MVIKMKHDRRTNETILNGESSEPINLVNKKQCNKDIIIFDFTNLEQKEIGEIKIDPKRKYEIDYDSTTCVYYKSYRIKKIDPISFKRVIEESAFKYPHMWDCYTGNILGDDPYGPLYFNPINLLCHFYQSRLTGLWIPPENGYEGYYGDLMGAGEDITIQCRGIYPERYIFRVPIPNCYLKKNHNLSIVTMGPKLTDREICALDRILIKHWSKHHLFNKLYKKIGSLFKMKHYYDVALAKEPLKMDLSGLDLGNREYILKQDNPNLCLNRYAVEVLKKM